MTRVLTGLLVVLLIGGAAAVGYAAYTPLAGLRAWLPGAMSARPEALLRNAGLTPDAGASLARGTGRLDDTGVAWHLDGLSATPSGLRYAITATGALEGDAALILLPWTGGVHLRDGRFATPAARLLGLPPERLAGDITVSVAAARVGLRDSRIDALRGQVLWQEAALVLDERIELGTLHGALSDSGPGKLRLAVSGAGGDAALSGTVVLDPSARVADLDLTLRPEADAPPALAAILDGWGTREGETWRIARQIDLP